MSFHTCDNLFHTPTSLFIPATTCFIPLITCFIPIGIVLYTHMLFPAIIPIYSVSYLHMKWNENCRYEIIRVGMKWQKKGMKLLPFLDRIWSHTIWYEFFACFFLMGIHDILEQWRPCLTLSRAAQRDREKSDCRMVAGLRGERVEWRTPW